MKKKFKMPHLLWLMLGLVVLSCLATYIIPAGKFAVDLNGKILADQFEYLGNQTPISLWQGFCLIKDGLVGASTIIFVVMISGANIHIILETKAIDDFMNWSLHKMKDKNKNILIILLFFLMAYLGGFGGTDALIAVVPIGLLFSKKLKLDPIVALGVTTFATLIGFGTGPAQQATTQMLMGIAPYSSFFTRFAYMNFFIIVGIIMVLSYVKKIQKNPENSLMYSEGWNPNKAENKDNINENELIKETKISWKTFLILIVFFTQYLIIVLYPLLGGDNSKLFNVMIAVLTISSLIIGLLGGMSGDELGKQFGAGLASMAFIGFIIGLAKVISLILNDGNVIHTIVYTLTKPLKFLPESVTNIGIAIIVSILNPLIPSATSKAAILVPIIHPVAETLKLNLNIVIVAFQLGDGFTNLISPLLGWMVGSCVMAEVPFSKWVKWVFPKVIIFMLLSFALIFILTITGWTGRF
ncbi:AbgT family transporter [Fusobacterium simiae]|uniref:AbgT family transporter n=1 Tax=Fusobacterium simiae TaxID=855 RepID=A0ABT4DEL0_FUSSI|nr:AbgT family transporter [Fusobacterium simiae]MCY7007027.1 AbgT family transporter [Fusobacterium simiae]